jgi:hypothetical protein
MYVLEAPTKKRKSDSRLIFLKDKVMKLEMEMEQAEELEMQMEIGEDVGQSAHPILYPFVSQASTNPVFHSAVLALSVACLLYLSMTLRISPV